MTGGTPPSGRLTPRQAVGWGIAFVIIVLLVLLFFLYGRQVRPVLSTLPAEAWQTILS
jgi:hypothetical protein